MGYGMSYTRRPAQRTGPRANRYDAACSDCRKKVPAGTGILTGSRDLGWSVRHGDRKWLGAPCGGDAIGKPGMGRWAGGCEEFAGQPDYEPAPRTGRRDGRCEDAPCCGCCG